MKVGEIGAGRIQRFRRVGIVLLALPFCLALAAADAHAGYTIAEMVDWASEVDALDRGFIDIANPGFGDVTYGAEADVLGEAEGDTLTVLSLGDGGSITLFFEEPIHNGPGDDLAVFENGFFETGTGLLFAELAFVEVSSNGVDFVRFPTETFQSVPLQGLVAIDPLDYFGFAGLDPAGEGTGFDLAELADEPLVQMGIVDILAIEFVRLVDVIGDGSTVDSLLNPVYDPYPSAFASGGFDLDGVGAFYVPEPSGGALAASGACLLVVLDRRRRRSATARSGAAPIVSSALER